MAGMDMPTWPDDLPPELPSLPPFVQGIPKHVFDSLAKMMLPSIHRSHVMPQAEKEAHLRSSKWHVPIPSGGCEIVSVEDPNGLYGASTGGVVWPAAGALAEFLGGDAATLPDAGATGQPHLRVVELGAGVGAVGIFLAKYKGFEVTLTDVPMQIPLLERNVAANFRQGGPRPAVAPLSWGDAAEAEGLGAFDLVVGSAITYRPEFMAALMASATKLLRPGGRFILAHNDRSDDVVGVEDVLESHFRIVSQRSVRRGGSKGCDAIDVEGEVHNVRIFTMEAIGREASSPTAPPPSKSAASTTARAAYPAALSEIEAEFERLTGIRPDPIIMPDGYKPPAPAAAEAMKPKASLKDVVISDLRQHGLQDVLYRLDDGLQAKLNAVPEERRPKGREGCQAFAEAYYNSLSVSALGVANEAPPPDVADASYSSRLASGEAGLSGSGPAAAQAPGKGPQYGVARICMKGLEWRVDVDDDKQELSATVVFGQAVWDALQGTGNSHFREAVDFDLAEDELRVSYSGAPVLEVRLHRRVDPGAGAAKLCSRRRRVQVKVPLLKGDG